MTDILRPHEAIARGFLIDGMEEDEADRLAQRALAWLVRSGYVLERRKDESENEDVRRSEFIHLQSENN